MSFSFDQIALEPEQKELFIQMAEAAKSVPRENRSPFILANSKDGTCIIAPAPAGRNSNIRGFANGDPEVLASNGLLNPGFGSRGGKNYIITPEGFLYYEWLMKQQGKPVERIEKQTLQYLEFAEFRKKYRDAYRKLKEAEEMLWAAEKEEQFTIIGHLCRVSMKKFAADLHTQVFGSDLNEDKKYDIKRMRAVIDKKGAEKGETVKPFLDALLAYWGTLSDLANRQAHGNEKEGEALTWEDARRLVFQTVNVMVELDRALGVKS
ncbi:MAG: hypothetical protein JJU35_11185 [Balneolales bacterium]|nr:hypothetical protein [Balneolales bacterium]